MPLRPTDIPRPGVARPGRVTAQPSTVQLPRITQPQAAATADVAQSTRRKASEVERLAAKRRAAGRENAAALDDQAAALNRTGESVSRGLSAVANAERQAAEQVSFAQAQFAKTIGGIANTFGLLEENRREAQDKSFLDRFELEAAKAGTTVEADHLNAPEEGPAYIEALDSKLEETYKSVAEKVSADLGYEPSETAKSAITSRGFDLRTGAARRTAVAANNARVQRIVSVADANVIDIARTVGGSGDLALALQQADAVVATLGDVLPTDQLEARRQAARETVIQATVLGHLERGEIDQARLITDDLTGFAGEKANAVQRAIVEAAKAEGVDPALLLAISRRETGGTFDPKSKTFTDPKTGRTASSASGLFHMIDSTRRAYVKPGEDPDDFAVQAKAGARLTADNIRGLKRAIGSEPTPAEVHLAHVLGLSKATAVITADPEAELSEVLTDKEIANSAPHLKGKTVADLIVWSIAEVQKNVEAVKQEGLIDGRDFSADFSGVPLDLRRRQ